MTIERGQRAINVIERLVHSTGPKAKKGRKPAERFILEEWERDFVRRLFGTLNAEGKRQYREAFLGIPRKNGKTALVAAIAISYMLTEEEENGEVVSAAGDREQASICFNQACEFILADKWLRKQFRILKSKKTIIHLATRTTYRAVSSDGKLKHGMNPSLVLADELHCWYRDMLYEALKSGQGARDEPLWVTMTTAGYDRESVCFKLWTHARKVAKNPELDPTFLPLIFEADPKDDWTSEATWRKANPNYGVSVRPEFLRKECNQALQIPSQQNSFKRWYLNIWTESNMAWLPAMAWDECGKIEFDFTSLLGQRCYGGLDLSSTTDLSAFVLTFPLEGGRVALLPHFWIPSHGMTERSQRDGVPYQQWVESGLITATTAAGGYTIDYDRIRGDILAMRDKYDIREVGLDRWNAVDIANKLTADGLTMYSHGQGMASMTAPSKEFERLVVGRQLIHGNNPVLNWMAGNVIVETDAAGNIKPTKEKSTGRIDGIVSSVMGIGRAGAHVEEAAFIPEWIG